MWVVAWLHTWMHVTGGGLFPIAPLVVPAWHAFGMWFLTIDMFPGLAALM